MKLPCKVIEDILPLYHDGICSAESRRLVEEHLTGCESCRAFLDAINSGVPVCKEAHDDMKPLEGIRSEWIKVRKRSLFKGIFGTLSAVLLLFGGWFGLTELRIFPVPAEKIEISDVSLLSDGTIVFHLYINDGKALNVLASDPDFENGIAYITPKRALIEKKHPVTLAVGNDRYYYVELEPFTREQFRNPAYEAEISAWVENGGSQGKADYYYSAEIQKICIGTEKDYIVLWEEGMDLPAADAAIEERYQSGIR